ncbi:unnamed protein product, partial [Ectocarpus sp. 12 AP-2014]
ARVSADEGAAASGPYLRRLVGVREYNDKGVPLVYASHSYRCDGEHVPSWIRHCRSVIHDRTGRETMKEREQGYVAMGYFALTIIRRWRKWAHREARLR